MACSLSDYHGWSRWSSAAAVAVAVAIDSVAATVTVAAAAVNQVVGDEQTCMCMQMPD